ncbi:YciI family protein [Fimbriiglobus ruber]|uniref:YCII-related n=1 Tax=Fimbriiglobus ruber TaxID=1908690 RepID=A0A225D8P4_9BACT|nr:YciI family protein [Fimbriiglobus ruber]OWK36014.1 YCII-related [Fimbriiglobus ruber]
MKWAAVIEYIQDQATVNEVRPAHRAYLTSLLETGKLVCAGPFLDNYGALIVYEAETEAGAEELIRNDPFHEAKVFVQWKIRPWKCVFGNPQLLPPNG